MELRQCLNCRELLPRGPTRCPLCGGGIGILDAWSLLGTRLTRYQLTELLGAGGMGMVYGAEHTGLGRRMAIKLLLPDLEAEEFVERFRREARVLAELHHRNIVEVYDFDVTPGGVPFTVMERLEGASLAAVLGRHGALAPAVLAALLADVGAALDYAHQRQIVHRDLKPQNIFVARVQGEVRAKLLDFGIAKKLAEGPEHTGLTRTGAMMGTPLYLTPEQIAGVAIDGRADQYALALIVAECLSGLPARAGLSVTEILERARQGPLEAVGLPADLPGATGEALRRATAPDPAARYPDVAAFVAALALPAPDWGELRALLAAPEAASVSTGVWPQPARSAEAGDRASLPTTPMPPTTAMAAPVPKRRRPSGRAIAAMALGLLAVLLAVLAFWNGRQPDSTAPGQPASEAAPLRVQARVSLPADAGLLLGVSNAGAVLRTAGGVHLIDLAGQRPPSRRADGEQERVLGVDENGALLLQRRDQLLAVDPRGGGEHLRLRGLPEDAEPVLRNDGLAAAYWRDGNWSLIDASGARTLGPAERPPVVSHLGARGLLWASATPVVLHWLDLADSRQWQAPSTVGRLHDLALDEDEGLAAACGFAPEVEVHRLGEAGPPRSLPVGGACQAAAFLPGGTLVARGERELLLWQSGRRQSLPLAGPVSGTSASLRIHRGELLQNEPGAGELLRLAIGSPLPRNAAEGAEVWDLAVHAGRLFFAQADGTLTIREGQDTRRQRIHEAGITDLAAAGEHLASASDDRTLAVWRLPEVAMAWRTRGHDFLVNQLWLAEDASALWSSSSDGSLKRWRWPMLEVEETVDLRALTSQGLSLHALWFDDAQREALVGTWNHRLVHLERVDAGWRAETWPIASRAGYRLLPLPALDVVILLGLEPSRLLAIDRRSRRLAELPATGMVLYALAPGSEAERFLAAGAGVAAEYVLARAPEGDLVAARRVLNRSDFGVVGAADYDATARRWWLGGARGEALALTPQELPEAGAPRVLPSKPLP